MLRIKPEQDGISCRREILKLKNCGEIVFLILSML